MVAAEETRAIKVKIFGNATNQRTGRKAYTDKCWRSSLTLLLCESLGIEKTAHFVVDIIAGCRGWFHIWKGNCNDASSKSHNITGKTEQRPKTMRQLVDQTTHANFPPSGPSWLFCLRSRGSVSEESGKQKKDLHRCIAAPVTVEAGSCRFKLF
jgi:hypothetical protein